MILPLYQVVTTDQEKNLSILKSKLSSQLYLIKQITFSSKPQFQKHLCRYNHLQESQQSQNILNLQKVWIEEHSTFCSNTYKIFTMYQHSNVTLLDQMQARKEELKHFQQQQLLGIIQSSINAFSFQPPILLSPKQFFIVQNGLLKINNKDLFDTNSLESYTKGVYYSPQKMQNFNESCFYSNTQNYMRQTIFSLGMTILSAIYLEDLSEKVYDPLNLNKKMKLNFSLVMNLIGGIDSKNMKPFSSRLLQLIKRMVEYDPKNRPSFFQIQQQIQIISKLKTSTTQVSDVSQCNDPEKVLKNIDLNINNNKEQNQVQFFKNEILSTIYEKNNQNPLSFSKKIKTQNSQYEIIKQLSNKNIQIFNENLSQVNVPMVYSTNVQNSLSQYRIDRQNFQYQKQLPSPISKENPIFTNPQFLSKINDEISKFKLQKKSPFGSTQISRKNSNIFLLRQSQTDNQQ